MPHFHIHKNYEGKEVCQGCQRTGAQKPRYKREGLCEDCAKELRAGRNILDFQQEEYISLHLQWYYYSKEVHDLAKGLFSAIHKPNLPYGAVKGNKFLAKGFGDGRDEYYVPTKSLEPILQALQALNQLCQDVKAARESLQYEAKQAVTAEKQRIYDEGVEAGRNLLFQLNNGEITMQQFGEKLKYTYNPLHP